MHAIFYPVLKSLAVLAVHNKWYSWYTDYRHNFCIMKEKTKFGWVIGFRRTRRMLYNGVAAQPLWYVPQIGCCSFPRNLEEKHPKVGQDAKTTKGDNARWSFLKTSYVYATPTPMSYFSFISPQNTQNGVFSSSENSSSQMQIVVKTQDSIGKK